MTFTVLWRNNYHLGIVLIAFKAPYSMQEHIPNSNLSTKNITSFLN